jgi:hypothetical protein
MDYNRPKIISYKKLFIYSKIKILFHIKFDSQKIT